jgi:uncharacterized protein YecT (DUF1311 family)
MINLICCAGHSSDGASLVRISALRPYCLAELGCALLASCQATAPSSHAGADKEQQILWACVEAADSTPEQRECYQRATQRADIALEAVLKATMAKLAGQEKARDSLQLAQSRWSDFRQAACAAEMELYEGGTIARTMYWACMARETRQRVAHLKEAYNYYIGN